MDQEKPTRSDLKVLLVEDDQEFANILKIRLSKEKSPPLEISCPLYKKGVFKWKQEQQP